MSRAGLKVIIGMCILAILPVLVPLHVQAVQPDEGSQIVFVSDRDGNDAAWRPQ